MANPIPVADLNDPRLDCYRDLKTRQRSDSEYFIGEGRWVVERMLASDFEVESILVTENQVDAFRELPAAVSLFVVSKECCQELVGFPFHRGVLACGVRQVCRRWELSPTGSEMPVLLCALPQINLGENLGAIIRSAVAFGARGCLLGPACADPFGRRTIRASMGNLFRLPIVQPGDLAVELQRLKCEYGFELVAASCDPQAIPSESFAFGPRTILVLGHEGSGLAAHEQANCDRAVTVSLAGQVDSLNVASAAAILFYEWRRQLSE